MDLEAELLGKESYRRHKQQVLGVLSGLSSSTTWKNPFLSSAAFASSQGYWNGESNRFSGLKPTNLDDIFGSHDPTILSHLQGLTLDAGTTQLWSPTGMPMHHSMNHRTSNYALAINRSSHHHLRGHHKHLELIRVRLLLQLL